MRLDDKLPDPRAYRRFVRPIRSRITLDAESVANVRYVEASEAIPESKLAVRPRVERMATIVPAMAVLDLELDQLSTRRYPGGEMSDTSLERDPVPFSHVVIGDMEGSLSFFHA